MKLCYLAGPIDSGLAPNDRMRALYLLHQAGISVYRPWEAFQIGLGQEPDDDRIRRINEAALDRADCLLALAPLDVMSMGTPLEIWRALNQGKPVAIVTDRQWWTWAGEAAHVTGSVEEAVNWLQRELYPAINVTAAYQVGARHPRESGLHHSESFFKRWELEAVVDESPEYPKLPLGFAGPGMLPTRSYADDAGLDLAAHGDWRIVGHSFLDVDTGLHVELPEGVWGLITGRSSTVRKRGLLVNQGIIDTGYRGRLYVGVWNLRPEQHVVQHGDRLAQLILFDNTTRHYEPLKVEESMLSKSERGENGFGSSGA